MPAFNIKLRYGGHEKIVNVYSNQTIGDLKTMICENKYFFGVTEPGRIILIIRGRETLDSKTLLNSGATANGLVTLTYWLH